MTKEQFTADELKTIDKADDLHISPFREGGVTDGTFTWMPLLKQPFTMSGSMNFSSIYTNMYRYGRK